MILNRFVEAKEEFNWCRDMFAKKYCLGVREHVNELVMGQGGIIKFGVVAQELDIVKYLGYEWYNVFPTRLEDSRLKQMCLNVLFKPVYTDHRNDS